MPVVNFKRLFTPDEFAAIKASTDNNVQAYLDQLNSPGLGVINIEDDYTVAGINYLKAIGILTQDRTNAILAGRQPG